MTLSHPTLGPLRWYVRREYLRPTRLGERPDARSGAIVWVVTPVFGLGAQRTSSGLGGTAFTSRTKALDFAHTQARRAYGTRKAN